MAFQLLNGLSHATLFLMASGLLLLLGKPCEGIAPVLARPCAKRFCHGAERV